ncbi:MAG: SPW repeat domain-containing protein [Bacteroidota bacterium]
MWQAWVNGILGLWLMVAAFLGFSPTVNLWNNLVVGLIVAIVGYTFVKQKPWQAWVCMVFGVWMIIAAFIPSLTSGQGYLWNDLISGLIIAIGGFGALGGAKTVKQE